MTLTTVAPGVGGTGLTAPGTAGNVLTSNGAAWVSSAPAGGGVTSITTAGALTASASTGAVTLTTAVRAWVNFNGTGTVAIRASFNVSSITDNGTGDYTVNFTNALPDADYAAIGNCDTNPSQSVQFVSMFVSTVGNNTVAPTTSGFRLSTRTSGGAGVDETYILVSVFR